MSEPRPEVADVFRTYGDDFLALWERVLSRPQRKAFDDIRNCRTAALGGHVQYYDCGHCAISYNSCLMGSNSLWGSTLCIGRKVAISCPFLSPLKRDSRESCQFVWRSNDLGLRCGGTTVLAGSDFLLRLPRVLISVVVKLTAE